MIFSLGNLISILVVVIILVIYRQIDRSNRSLEKVKRFSDKIRENLNALVEEKTADMKNLSIELGVNLKTGKEVLKRVREVEESLKQKTAGVEEIQAKLDGYDRALGELVGMTARVDENLKRIQGESLFVDKVGKRITETSQKLQKIEQDAGRIQEKLYTENHKGMAALRAEATRELDAQVQGLKSSVENSEKRVKDFSTYLTRLEGRAAEMERERLESLKKSFEEFEVEARLKRSNLLNQFVGSLNKLLAEADAKGKQLKGSLAEAAAASGQVLQSHQQFLQDTERFKEDVSKKMELAAEEMQVGVLKKVELNLESYEREVDYRFQKLEAANVDIEALEANLRGAMERAGAKIKQDFELFNQKLGEERKAEQEKVQGEFAALQSGMAELEAGLTELKAKAYENVSEQLQVFEDEFFKDLKKRSLTMEEKLGGWQAELESRMQEISATHAAQREALEKGYAEQLKGELERVKHLTGEELRRLEGRAAEFEAAVAERVGSAEKRVTEFADRLPAQIESIRQEAQSAYQKELEVLEELIGENIQRLKREMDGAVGAMRDEFTSQRDDLITSTGEERLELKNEFKGIQERIGQLEAQLVQASEKALEKFRSDWESFQSEFGRKTKETQTEMESRVKEVKGRLAEMRDKSEVLQASLFGKIDESYKSLGSSLADMDKRVKGFLAQTKLFERADELKVLLENRIEEMKRDLEKLAAQRKEMEEADGRLAATRKTVEELGAKLSKLLAERGKVDDMDSDFKKLLSISKDLDQRIDTVYSSQDALQEIQAKIRELENLEKTTEGRFERLEKKKAIIEATTGGVDKNFQQLEVLEKSLGAFKEEAKSLSVDLIELKGQAELLAANKEKSEYVVRKVGDLDGLLADLEGRMEKLEKAREWLAKTETRFENIGKQAQEQVRLLESILKAEKKQSKGEDGAPSLDKRDTVIKLAHLGWSAPEIARTTRLSRGEVELILELAPKS